MQSVKLDVADVAKGIEPKTARSFCESAYVLSRSLSLLLTQDGESLATKLLAVVDEYEFHYASGIERQIKSRLAAEVPQSADGQDMRSGSIIRFGRSIIFQHLYSHCGFELNYTNVVCILLECITVIYEKVAACQDLTTESFNKIDKFMKKHGFGKVSKHINTAAITIIQRELPAVVADG